MSLSTITVEICILNYNPQRSTGNFRVIGNYQRAPENMPEVDMTTFLINNRLAYFTEGIYDILSGKDGEFIRHMSTATKVSFTPGR